VSEARPAADPWAGITAEHGCDDLDRLVAAMGEAIARTGADASGDPVVAVDPSRILDVMGWLRAAGYEMLTDVTAVDYPEEELRFVVVYHVTRLADAARIRVKAFLPAVDPEIDSCFPLWRSADWLERETWDMFGVRFRGHPNHRRILMPDDYPHHPLRKEFPVTGDIAMQD